MDAGFEVGAVDPGGLCDAPPPPTLHSTDKADLHDHEETKILHECRSPGFALKPRYE